MLTFFNGIYKYQNGRFINFPVSDRRARSLSKPVSDMVQISDDKYVVLVDNGAYLFNGKSFSLLDAGNDLLKSNVNSVAWLPNGNIVLGTDEGIFLYDVTNGSPQLNGWYLNNRSIIKTLVTHGKIWVLTGRGILRFDANATFPFLTKSELFLGKSKIKDISSDKNGTIWAYTDRIIIPLNANLILFTFDS